MKKLLLSVLTLGVVSAIAISATQAYFSDTAVLGTNTVASGRVDIDPRLEMAVGFTLNGMMPGEWSNPYQLDLYNTSNSSQVKYRFYDTNATETVGGFYANLNVIVRHTFAGTPNPGVWPIVYQGKLQDMYVHSVNTAGVISDYLATNNSHVYYFQFQLDPSAGDVYQSAGATFKVTVDATQPGNGVW